MSMRLSVEGEFGDRLIHNLRISESAESAAGYMLVMYSTLTIALLDIST